MKNNTGKSPRRPSSSSSSIIQSLMESTSYDPSQKPVFDTSSSSNCSSSSSSSQVSEPKDMSTTTTPSSRRANPTNNTPTTSSGRDEFLHARVLITSGRYVGLTGRIGRIVATGWIYIYDNPIISRPVRWGDVEVLHDSPSKTDSVLPEDEEERVVAPLYVDDDMHDPDDETSVQKTCVGTTPDLMGARIRVVDGEHAGLEGTIVEKLDSGIYFQLDVLPKKKIVSLEEVVVVSLPSSSQLQQQQQPQDDPIAKYTGATVRVNQDGTQCNVKEVLIGEWYITDNAEIQKAYRRNQFVVLSYADGTVPSEEDDVIHDKDEEMETKHEVLMYKKFSSRKRARISKEKDEDVRKSTREKVVKYPDVDEYSTDEREDDIPGRTPSIANDDEDSHSYNNNDQKTHHRHKNRNPLLGVTVRVFEGKGVGHIGKITKVCSRGWWELEGLNVKVKSNIVHFVDDGTFDCEAIRNYYSKNQRGTRMPAIVKIGDVMNWEKNTISHGRENTTGREDTHLLEIQHSHDGRNEIDEDMLITRATGKQQTTKTIGVNIRETTRHKLFSTDSTQPRITGDDLKVSKDKRLSEIDSIMQWGRKSATSLATSTVPNYEDDRCTKHRVRNRGRSVPVLDPILVKTSGAHLGEDDSKIHCHWLVPEGLRHLPPVTKIEIFNRRTGRIMKGEEAISLKDLPAALIEHAEYEPIVPPPANTDIPHRIGRSGQNIRVSKSVIPQCRVRASAVEGKHVLVIGGEYRGLSGIIDSTLPGGWYVISNLFKHDNLSLDVIVSSDNLELVPDNISWSQSTLPGDDTIKTRLRLQASKLRLDALREEKEKVLRSAASSNKDAVDINLTNLESEIGKVESAIDRHQKDLQELSATSGFND
ncbi:hypothetical protein ACHAW6_008497 [Cyclotella cf. meneghiniana]